MKVGPQTPVQLLQAQLAAVLGQLEDIDAKKVRAITDAILSADTTRLAALEAQAAPLRVEVESLNAQIAALL